MKKIKDFFYDKNDIIIVLLIVAIAGFIIYNRIDAIMDYPAKYAEEMAATETTEMVETTEATEAAEETGSSSSSTDSSNEEN